ncbi:molybdopterin-synthase adenylyltransferase MoeB [Marinobacter gelidimuriae]|uniref:molybdopterin-synthase adenylyltransferase MoeB n=1 Tax=Marinobacter gelidimuriae TaxID=2739064 RepID=UPI003899513D
MIVPGLAGGASGLSAPSSTEPGSVELSVEESLRYGRHLMMPEVTIDGQKRLKAAKVLIIGAGGLGSPLGFYLAAAGVGRLGIVDDDVVEVSNLHRQILFTNNDVGRPKAEVARERLKALNPDIEVNAYPLRLTSENAGELIGDYDIVVDGTDNFATRYLVNDACVLANKPNVYGSIARFEGQVSVFWAEHGPCYRCLYPEPPPPGLIPSCAEGGVLGVLPGVIGVLQAVETIKLILSAGQSLVGHILLFDAMTMDWKKLHTRKDPHCALCGEQASITVLQDYEAFCGAGIGPDADPVPQISVEALKAKLDRGEKVSILDVRDPHEYRISQLPAATLIPLGELERRIGELDPSGELVVHCKSGVRSADAVRLLNRHGFDKAVSLQGGISAWAEKIDPQMLRY